MKVKKSRISVIISFVLAVIALCALLAITLFMPTFVDSYIELSGARNVFTSGDIIWIKAILYAILIPAYIADISLICILRLVNRGEIFSEGTVYLLRLISLCCFTEVILFGALSIFFILGLIISFAALFLGIVLRVVKNVIEEANAIKAENDFTV